MYWFRIEQTLQPTEREPAAGECAAVLLSSAPHLCRSQKNCLIIIVRNIGSK